jgi:hypothetical protein
MDCQPYSFDALPVIDGADSAVPKAVATGLNGVSLVVGALATVCWNVLA